MGTRTKTGKRYGVMNEPQHDCCFGASVVDHTRPVMIDGKHYKGKYDTVAECFDASTAQMIADALNAAPEQHPSDGA